MASGQPLSDIIAGHFSVPSPGAVNDKIRSYFDKWYFGTGSPEGAVTAATGSLYIQDDGTTNIIWQKVSGAGNTGWSALSPSAENRQTKRVSTGAVAASASAEVVVAWDTAFSDANYTPVVTLLETTAGENNLRLERIVAQVAASITVRVTNVNALNARTGTINAVAFAD